MVSAGANRLDYDVESVWVIPEFSIYDAAVVKIDR
ncbi:MAG: hypothetical protein JWM11_2968 [Planctomycetaceae bacterium]|nr:hypothetical protein [Planctomycetaceae bacterium]